MNGDDDDVHIIRRQSEMVEHESEFVMNLRSGNEIKVGSVMYHLVLTKLVLTNQLVLTN